MEKANQLNTECQKLSDMTPSIDRLSALPDEVICHFLSFLPTKTSVSTTILAKRWMFLWAHVPHLDFTEDDESTTLDVGESLLEMVNRLMLLYKVENMDSFGLFYSLCYPADHETGFDTCINAANVRNVKNMHFSTHGEGIHFPISIFTSKNLVDLKLQYIDFLVKGVVCLPALKRLRLEFYRCGDSEDSFPHLLAGCPVLEDLIVDRFLMDSSTVSCHISSPTIKRMILNSELCKRFDPYIEAHRLKIDTPALRYLQLNDTMSEDLSAGSLDSLIEADIKLDGNGSLDGNVLYSRSVIEFVSKLRNVKTLKLSCYHVKVRNLTAPALAIKFPNLTKLEFAGDWRYLSYFLGNADNLEVAIIREVHKVHKKWINPQQVPTCLISHLRSVTIEDFKGTELEFELTRYLLNNAKVLKRMEIYWRNQDFSVKETIDTLDRISSFHRGSEACELVFD